MDYKEKVIALLKMQELSKEQKEKLESIFPELKKSEDEKIIKHDIIKFIKKNKSPFAPVPSDITLDKWIAWLEKQGEQKPIEPQQDMLSQEKYSKAVDECIYGEKPVEWKQENVEELTEFEKAIYNRLDKWNGDWCDELEDETKDFAKELLSIARKQLTEEAVNYMNKHIPIITTNIAICDERYTTILKEECIEGFRKALEKGE